MSKPKVSSGRGSIGSSAGQKREDSPLAVKAENKVGKRGAFFGGEKLTTKTPR
jgi:hypothetical protein